MACCSVLARSHSVQVDVPIRRARTRAYMAVLPACGLVSHAMALLPRQVLELKLPVKAWIYVARWLRYRRALDGRTSDAVPWLNSFGARHNPSGTRAQYGLRRLIEKELLRVGMRGGPGLLASAGVMDTRTPWTKKMLRTNRGPRVWPAHYQPCTYMHWMKFLNSEERYRDLLPILGYEVDVRLR